MTVYTLIEWLYTSLLSSTRYLKNVSRLHTH